LLELVGLRPLMDRTLGRAEVQIGLVDGPVLIGHPDLAGDRIREIPSRLRGTCSRAGGVGCAHGTFVAGILSARRNSSAPAICPECTLLVRPIFTETAVGGGEVSAAPDELATAIIDSVEAGADVINISAAIARPWLNGEQRLREALDHAARREVLVVAAAGNHGTVGGSMLASHPWVVPVGACDRWGRPTGQSNLGRSIARRGLAAPGEDVESLSTGAGTLTLGGTSAAAAFVTGAIALLLSAFIQAGAPEVKFALTRASTAGRLTMTPPLLDARAAYRWLEKAYGRGSALGG
jgi:subtilisin family serine protease